MRYRSILAAVTVATTLLSPSAAPARRASGSPNMTHVVNLPYQLLHGQNTQYGTDIEFVTLDVTGLDGAGTLTGPRDFALAGTYRNGLQIIDITDPENPVIASVYDCAVAQGDVQVFQRDAQTYATFTMDSPYTNSQGNTNSACFKDLGITDRTKSAGTFIADISNPYRPVTVSHVFVSGGSHNQTVHPSGNYLYNSNSNGPVVPSGKIEVIDITDLRKPTLVKTLQLQTGSDSHDITFNESGTRAYSAALDHTLILDTTDPANPTVIGRIKDPALDIHHQSDPVTITDPVLGERTFLIVTDEWMGGGTGGYCPGGGLHVYDVTGELEKTPVKIGFFAIPDVRVGLVACTSHVLRIYPEQKKITIAWYNAGVRVLDISGLAGISAGASQSGSLGQGIKEVGFFVPDGADTWSAKAYRIEDDGSFYVFANDINRGLDVYHYNNQAAPASDQGRWLTPSEALATAKQRRALNAKTGPSRPFCLVGTR